ncbi:post-GPI attachment to proteins factor 3-like [Oppia nitens]|uniref:post-GPI attachment to proteins factor 3-like n=1 Tax=Oppia nitens TaxID=1686743 RepID=UPI0023DCC497|nr:post-GPI attachment to proteins factor 3-like [Oppia nitens]XP_054165381.1 post-GPI attachment to proteins factor 3-like [Oppia nitens]
MVTTTTTTVVEYVVVLVAIILAADSPDHVWGSLGDRLPYYNRCLYDCIDRNCTTDDQLRVFADSQPNYMAWIGWDCRQECQHQCQWRTIDQWLGSPLYNGHRLPQFYGKWTFYRLFGIEEPASMICSVLNLVTNLYGWNQYRKSVANNDGGGGGDPHFTIQTVQAFLAVNAWFWSTIFHTRQTSISEKFDYFSAYSLVIYSLYALVIRVLMDSTCSSSGSIKGLPMIARHWSLIGWTVGLPFLSFFIYHCYYLYFIHFDYGYNVKVNVITGLFSSIGWLLWCYSNRRHQGNHIWKCILSIGLLNSLLLLELYDFPPVAFIFDAHSLWHLGTAPIPILWFSFLTDININNRFKSKIL